MAYNPDFAGLVARKYQIQQQQADTAGELANANVGYLGAETAAYPQEAAARAFATRAGGQTSLAQANLFNQNANLAPWLAGSEVNERNAAAGLSTAQAARERYNVSVNPDITYAGNLREFGRDTADGMASQGGGYSTPGMLDLSALSRPTGISGIQQQPLASSPVTGIVARGGNDGGSTSQVGGTNSGQTSIYSGPGNNVIGGNPVRSYSEGTDKVPGKGDGKTDTQAAMLAPGEAVLNRGAAEHLGRDTISLLNAIGARRMGLTVGSDLDTSTPNKGSNAGVDNQTGAPDSGPHYAGGTPDVRGAYPYGTPSHPMDESSATPQTSWPRTPADDPFDQGMTPHYAWGTPNVGGGPAPGQTVSNGSWDPAEAQAQMTTNSTPPPPIRPQPMPDPAARTFGKRVQVPGYSKGTSNVPDKGKSAGNAAGKSAEGKGKSGGKMSPHAARHTPDGSGLSPGIMEALMSMGGMGGAGAPGGTPGAGAGMPPPSGPVGMGVPPAGNTMAPVSLPPLARRAA